MEIPPSSAELLPVAVETADLDTSAAAAAAAAAAVREAARPPPCSLGCGHDVNLWP